MIGWLEGVVRGRVIVTGSGVGYTVSATRLPAEGENVKLHITTVVREDAITLYGFENELEQEMFHALTKLQGIGPSLAMSVLRELGAEATIAAVRAKEITAFKRVPGCGAKTAERIVMNINLPALAEKIETDGIAAAGDELCEALIGLGFDAMVARSSVASARSNHGPQASDEEVLAGALAHARGEQV